MCHSVSRSIPMQDECAEQTNAGKRSNITSVKRISSFVKFILSSSFACAMKFFLSKKKKPAPIPIFTSWKNPNWCLPQKSKTESSGGVTKRRGAYSGGSKVPGDLVRAPHDSWSRHYFSLWFKWIFFFLFDETMFINSLTLFLFKIRSRVERNVRDICLMMLPKEPMPKRWTCAANDRPIDSIR